MAKKKNTDAKAQAAGSDGIPRLSAHPRAQAQIAQAKGGAGLAVFVLVVLLSAGSNVPWPDTVARAIVLGMAGYMVAWAVAVTVWRQIARAELEMAKRTVVLRQQQA